jgi:UDP-N-acetylmuramate dehydrogenase
MDKVFLDILRHPEVFYELKGKSYCNKSIGNISWLKTGGSAEYLYIPKDEKDLSLILESLREDVDLNIFGKLSNILVRDGGLKGLSIIIPQSFGDIKILSDTKLMVGAGITDKILSQKCLNLGIGGMEFLCGIPGTLGGGIFMNAGCFGSEFKDIVTEVNFLTKSGKKINKKNKEIEFSYRKSNIPRDFIITSAIVEGFFKNQDEINKLMDEVNLKRVSTQPQGYPTGGSTFKNTANNKAWELINSSGMSKAFFGDAMVSNIHSNFLVNKGNASANDFETLGNMIIDKVKSESGITLEWEIHIVGGNE